MQVHLSFCVCANANVSLRDELNILRDETLMWSNHFEFNHFVVCRPRADGIHAQCLILDLTV